jgi:TonB family protein
METISRDLLTFLLNSLWQVTLAAAVAAGACRVMRKGPASHRHAVWVAALLASVMLPVASLRRPAQVPGPVYSATLAEQAAPSGEVQMSIAQGPPIPEPARTIYVAARTASVLLGAYLLFVLLGLARLGWASLRTVQIRGTARAPRIPEHLGRVWERCQAAFGLTGVELLCSDLVSGPVTAGGAIILPESLLSEGSEDVLTTAIGHEMAHIARRDFACNVAYEVMCAPISFHPAVWLMRREIERTREMACDELVTARLMDAGAYARSIVSIAGGMMALPRPGYTLGVFDGDILEERVRRLLERPAANLRRARLLLAGGLAALGLCAAMASGLAVTAWAQAGASPLMKLGEAAFNLGDYKEAEGHFQNAVTVEPGNIKAKLFLAHTLLQQYIPGTAGQEALLAGVRKQYQDVLAVEPGNKPALEGMMLMHVNQKQFSQGREWAMKAIQANPREKAAYYTIGFIDWVVTYPDYAAARTTAGMRPEDSGIIPDAALRQKVTQQHGVQIEEAFRVLQIAIDIDPDYSDAMAYINLMYRIKAALDDTAEQSAADIRKADDWVRQALDAKKRMAQKPRNGSGTLDVEGPAPAPFVPAPPPPPPPPGNPAGIVRVEAPGLFRMTGEALEGQLVKQVPPEYPASGGQGEVRMSVIVTKEGTVRDITVMTTPSAELAAAAMKAVSQWQFRPTRVNGVPVEVVSTVTVNFARK